MRRRLQTRPAPRVWPLFAAEAGASRPNALSGGPALAPRPGACIVRASSRGPSGRRRPAAEAANRKTRVRLRWRGRLGWVAEWSKAHAWNACRRATVSWVRIPPHPPLAPPQIAGSAVPLSGGDESRRPEIRGAGVRLNTERFASATHSENKGAAGVNCTFFVTRRSWATSWRR